MTAVRFPLEGLNRSGGVRVVVALANALVRAGVGVTLLVPDYASESPFPLEPEVRREVVPTHRRGKLARLEYLTQLAVRASRDADLVVATGHRTPWLIMASELLCRTRSRRLYLVQHYETVSQGWAADGTWLRRASSAVLAELGYLLPFERVSVSSWIREQLPLRHGTHVVLNGVDPLVFHTAPKHPRSPDDLLVVGCIGRRGRVKGWSTFLQALDHVECPRFRVLVASPTGLDCVDANGRRDMTVIQPATDRDVADFYRACDVFVYPSLLEGFGLPPLEAMACGIPVITADCGGVRDFVTAENAVVVPPGDARALARAIDRVVTDPDLRGRLAEAGLRTASAMSMDHSMRQHVAIIRSMLELDHRSPAAHHGGER